MITASGVALAIALLAGCGSSSSSSSTGSSQASGGGDTTKSGTHCIAVPETKTTRYEAKDKTYFTDKVKALCPNCTVDYENANQDSNTQLNQAQTALTKGAKVLVLDPVDGEAAEGIVQAAKDKGVPVISYDRLANGPISYYISLDNEKVGELQGTALVGAITDKSKQIIMINGSPTDPNAGQFRAGAHKIIEASGIKIGKEYDTPDWSNDKAQDEAQQAITAIGKANVGGVYAANDGMAGGAYASMVAAGLTSVPLTGQDSQADGIQRVLAGQQTMTIYKAIKPEAEDAATLAVQLIQGSTPSVPGFSFTKQNNKTADIPSILLTPVAVTKDNVKSTVIADDFLKASDICTAQYKDACSSAGIS